MMELDQETLRAVLESLPAAVYLVDLHRRILLWNDGAAKLTGYLSQEVIGRCCADDLLMHCDDAHENLCGEHCPLAQTIHDGHARETDVYLRHKDGQRVPVHVRAVPVRNERGAIVGAAECFDLRLVFPAAEPAGCPPGDLDEVTELPGRAATADCLESAVDGFARHGIPFGVLRISLGNQDELVRVDGRLALNAVLYAAAQTLRCNLGPADFVGRCTVDGFLAIVYGGSETGLAAAAAKLQRLASLAAAPWWGDRLPVSLSIEGTVVQAGDTVESLLARIGAAQDHYVEGEGSFEQGQTT